MVATLYHEWLSKVVGEALKVRNTKTGEEEKGDFVFLDQEFFTDLQQTNFMSSKRPHR